MNHQIPLKFRAIAAGLQAIATLPAASVVFIPISSFMNISGIFLTMEGIFPGFIYLSTVFVIASPIIIWILWLFTKSMHPFIDKSGKNALNYALNTIVGLLFWALLFLFIFALTCGSGLIKSSAEIGLAGTVCAIAVYCVAIAYFISSIVAGINAWNGSYFKSRFIYPFFDDSPLV